MSTRLVRRGVRRGVVVKPRVPCRCMLFGDTIRRCTLAKLRLPTPMRVHYSCRLHEHVSMLFSRLLLLPLAVASSVTLYVAPVPASGDTAAIASPVPLAQIDYDADQPVGTLVSYTPPTGSYSTDRLLRVGLTDPKSSSLHGVVTSAASFSEQYHKKIVIYVDDKGEPFHVGFSTSAKGSGKEVEVEIQKKNTGPKPVLNKPIVLNAEGKLGGEEPEKTFLQKYWWAIALFLIVQLAAGGGEK